MAIKVRFTHVQRGTLKPFNKQLEPYPYEVEIHRYLEHFALTYEIQGETIRSSFKVPKAFPLWLGQFIAETTMKRFERKVLRYLGRLKWT